jgi:hypothetical protein
MTEVWSRVPLFYTSPTADTVTLEALSQFSKFILCYYLFALGSPGDPGESGITLAVFGSSIISPRLYPLMSSSEVSLLQSDSEDEPLGVFPNGSASESYADICSSLFYCIAVFLA